ASTRELKRQQKQPPGISSTGNPFDRRRAVSTRPLLWSLLMSPTRFPRSVKRRASRAIAVVLPAPRKPPIMMYRARAAVTSRSFMAFPKHLVDRRVQHGNVALGVQAVGAGGPLQRIQPSPSGGIRLDQLDLFAQRRIS